MDTIAEQPPVLMREDSAGGISLLVLNRPRRRNSLSLELLRALREALAAIADDRSVRAVVLAAEGPTFCAGHDLAEITAHRDDADGGAAFYRTALGACAEVMQAIVALPQPVIAAAHGVATAAGCQLVATCDLAVVEETSRFSLPGVMIGLFCSTPAVAVSRAVSRKAAMEMLLTGDMIDAAEARRIGLVNRVVAPGTARQEALALAARIAERSALTLRLGKAAFHDQLGCDLAEAYRRASEVMAENLMAHDAAEGIGAFLSGRTPRWEDH